LALNATRRLFVESSTAGVAELVGPDPDPHRTGALGFPPVTRSTVDSSATPICWDLFDGVIRDIA
jgi:hypothetical protein